MSIPDQADNLQDFAVQSMAALLSRTQAWQAATNTDDAQSAAGRIIAYGIRKVEDGREVPPPFPFAIVTTPDSHGPELTDDGSGFGVAHDWKATVQIQLFDADDLAAAYGIERERFTSLHNTILMSLRNQYKAEFGDGADFQPTQDYRLVGYRLIELREGEPPDAAPYWAAVWELDLEGTIG